MISKKTGPCHRGWHWISCHPGRWQFPLSHSLKSASLLWMVTASLWDPDSVILWITYLQLLLIFLIHFTLPIEQETHWPLPLQTLAACWSWAIKLRHSLVSDALLQPLMPKKQSPAEEQQAQSPGCHCLNFIILLPSSTRKKGCGALWFLLPFHISTCCR